MANGPFKMKGWSPFTKSSPAKAEDYVATAANPKKQDFVNEAFAKKKEAINSIMSKHNVSRNEAAKIYNKNVN